jgi:hypothetical protein
MGLFHYDEESDLVYPTQHKWVWDGPRGVEKESPKKEKSSEDFFRVFVELTYDDFNDLWGKYLELL